VSGPDAADPTVPPKVTLGQRVLASLPQLRRAPTESGTGAPPSSDEPSRKPVAADPTTPAAAEATAAPPTEPASRQGRLRDSLLKPPPPKRQSPAAALADWSDEELLVRIKRIDDRERTYALFAAPLAVALDGVLTVATLNSHLPHTGKVNAGLVYAYAVARIVLAGLVVVAALSRRRSLVGFALMFLGVAMGNPLWALPFWGLGGWILWRAYRYQKVLAARGKGNPTATRRDRPAASSGRPAPAPAPATATRQSRRRRKSPAPVGPAPNKRYTPPKPTRPKPPKPEA